jgi:hypothetical protein
METLRNFPRPLIKKYVIACQTLLNKYKYPEHLGELQYCPLCEVGTCATCPWNTMELGLHEEFSISDRCFDVTCELFLNKVAENDLRLQCSEARNLKLRWNRSVLPDSYVKDFDVTINSWRNMRLKQLPRWISELESLLY